MLGVTVSDGFCLLWGKILRSSLWINESKETRILWVAMLALRDADGVVQASVVGLADAAKLTPDECRVSLKRLLAPDPDDSSGVEEGRRLLEVKGGWRIVNHELYRFSTEAKREIWRQTKAKQRERAKGDATGTPFKKSSPPDGAQAVARRSRAAGDTLEETDAKVQAYYDELAESKKVAK